MSKISKNIKMLDILSSGKIYSCKKLSEMLEVSQRTIRQYKYELEKEGIFIESIMGKDGGYRLHSKLEMPTILFNENDIKNIDLILNQVTEDDRKILDEIKQKIINYCRLIKDEEILDKNESEKIKIIQTAINKHEKLIIEYFSKDAKKQREIYPIQIYIYDKAIMIVAQYSKDPLDIRHLNLRRIEKIIN